MLDGCWWRTLGIEVNCYALNLLAPVETGIVIYEWRQTRMLNEPSTIARGSLQPAVCDAAITPWAYFPYLPLQCEASGIKILYLIFVKNKIQACQFCERCQFLAICEHLSSSHGVTNTDIELQLLRKDERYKSSQNSVKAKNIQNTITPLTSYTQRHHVDYIMHVRKPSHPKTCLEFRDLLIYYQRIAPQLWYGQGRSVICILLPGMSFLPLWVRACLCACCRLCTLRGGWRIMTRLP